MKEQKPEKAAAMDLHNVDDDEDDDHNQDISNDHNTGEAFQKRRTRERKM